MMDCEAFFEELYLSTREALLKYLCSFSGLDGWGEDILQDTYYEAYKRREMLARHPNPAGWLYQTARNLYRNARRRRDNYNLSLDIVPEGECISRAEEYYKYIEWNVTMQELLREKDRKLVSRYYIEGYSVREMAKEFNLTEANIRVRFTRIRKQMKSLKK